MKKPCIVLRGVPVKPKSEAFLSSTASFSSPKVPPARPHQRSPRHHDLHHDAAARPDEVEDKKSAEKRRSHHVGNHDDAEGGDDNDADDGGDDHGAGRHGNFKRSIKLLDYDDLRTRGIRMSRVQLWRLIRAGNFPRQIKVGTKNAWVEGEIDAWIESRIAARDFEAA
jgi:prophage regulatory protein